MIGVALYYMATHINLTMDFRRRSACARSQMFGLAFIFIPKMSSRMWESLLKKTTRFLR